VVRDGRQVRIAGRNVVRGDVVLLAEGDRVPADATLADCENFSVDESALTGESVPVRKAPATSDKATASMGRPGGEATPWVFSGTLVVKGHGIALVNGTGAGTELGRIGTALRTIEPECGGAGVRVVMITGDYPGTAPRLDTPGRLALPSSLRHRCRSAGDL
jgi:Ca2+-transporting ATPase